MKARVINGQMSLIIVDNYAVFSDSLLVIFRYSQTPATSYERNHYTSKIHSFRNDENVETKYFK